MNLTYKIKDCICTECKKHYDEWDGDITDGKFICFNCNDLLELSLEDDLNE